MEKNVVSSKDLFGEQSNTVSSQELFGEDPQSALTRSAIISHNTDSDKYAENRKTAVKNGLPAAFADPAENKASMDGMMSTIKDFMGLKGKTSEHMSDPNFAKVAKDDHPVLSKFEDIFFGFTKRLEGSIESDMNLLTSIPAAIGGAATGLTTLALTKGDTEAAKAVQEGVSNFLTYNPRTEQGQKNVEKLTPLISIPGQIGHELSEEVARQWNAPEWLRYIMNMGGEFAGYALIDMAIKGTSAHIQNIVDTAKESKLKGRDTEKFKNYVTDVAQEHEPVKMPVDKVDEILEAKNLKPEEVFSDPQAYYESKFFNDKVDIPIEDLAANAEHFTPENVKDMSLEDIPSVNEAEAMKPKEGEQGAASQESSPEMEDLTKTATEKGFKIEYVGDDVLHDYAGMNFEAAKDMGFKLPDGSDMAENTIYLDKNADAAKNAETLRHELHEIGLMREGKSYFEAHKEALGHETKETEVDTIPNTLRPAIKDGEEIKMGDVGQTHEDIQKDAPEENRGFVTPQGDFIGRKEASQWLKENKPDQYEALSDKAKNELHSEDLFEKEQTPNEEKSTLDRLKQLNENMGQAGRIDVSGVKDYLDKSKEEVKYSGDLQKDYYTLKNKSEIDQILTKRTLDKAEGKPEDYEAIYNWIEDKNEPLTDQQRKLYELEIEPIRKERNALFSKLRNEGVPVGGDEYTPRFTAEKGGFFDRLMQGYKMLQSGLGLMRKTTGSMKHRTMKAIEREGGEDMPSERLVVSVKNGEVTSFKDGKPESMGKVKFKTEEEFLDRDIKPLKKQIDRLSRELKTLESIKTREPVSVNYINKLKTEIANISNNIQENQIGVTEQGKIDVYNYFKKTLGKIDDSLNKLQTEEKILKQTKAGKQLFNNRLNKILMDMNNLHDREAALATSDVYEQVQKIAERAEDKNIEASKQAEKLKKVFAEYKTLAKIKTAKDLVLTDKRKSTLQRKIIEANKIIDDIYSNYDPNTLDDKSFVDKNGIKWKMGEATTKEIEANTGLKYHKNALLNEIVTYNELKKVDRAIQYLENLKSNPEFNKLAVKIGTQNIPEGYKATELPQLRGYAFPEKVSETFDIFYKHASQGLIDQTGLWSHINSFLRNAIFFNPLIHIPNISVHWAVNHGISPWLRPSEYPNLVRSSTRAIRAVLTMNDDYIQALEKGTSLLYSGVENKNLHTLMLEKMGKELESNTPLANALSKALGYANPVKLVKAIYNFSSRATWAVNDMATLQAIYTDMNNGMPMEKAISETAKHIPDYRIPPRIMNSTTVSKLMKAENGVTMFGAYHYGALKSYGEMAKTLIDKVPLKDKAAALDKIAMLVLTTYFIYPQLDKLAQIITGRDDVMVRRAGASTFPYKTEEFLKGNIDFADYVQSVLTPNVGLMVGMAAYMGRDPKTGKKEGIKDIALNAVAPISQGKSVYSGQRSATEAAESLFGISKYRTDAEKIANKYVRDHIPEGDPETADERNMKRGIINAIRKGEDLTDEQQESYDSMNDKQKKDIDAKAAMSPLQAAFHSIPIGVAMDVWSKATDDEREQLRDMYEKKVKNYFKNHPELNQDEIDKINEKLDKAENKE